MKVYAEFFKEKNQTVRLQCDIVFWMFNSEITPQDKENRFYQ